MAPKKGKNDPKGKKGQETKEKKSKNEKAQEERRAYIEDQETAIPAYLRDGITALDKNVNVENIYLTTPDGKIELIKNTGLQLVYGRKYGLIGKNGSGKSTLLRHISEYKLEGFPQYLRVMHVKQEVIGNDIPVLQFVLDSDDQRRYLEKEEQRLLAKLEGEGEDDEFEQVNQQLERVYERLEDIGARKAERHVRDILNGLQFTPEMQERPTKKLSGGWRMRVSLACALFVTPDILLLDEPTNHLDFPSVEWLQSYLRSYKQTIVIVSHDRSFLNAIITDVIDLDHQTLTYYRGDYDSYVKTRDENLRNQQSNFEKQEKKKLELKKFIEEAKNSKNAQMANLGASRKMMLDKMEAVEAVETEKSWSFSFPDPGALEHALVNCINMSFSWDVNEDGEKLKNQRLLLRDVNAHLDMKSRVGVLGANGVGKSTFIKLILGEYTPAGGTLKLNPEARVALFTQHTEENLDLNSTPLDLIQKMYPEAKEGQIRGFLGHFGFDVNLISHKIGTLSGGQKSRIAFAILTWRKPHLIIMDEPTNHLDLQTIEALIGALASFQGGILLVSHDAYFLQQVATEFWAVNNGGQVKVFHEDLHAAKEWSYKPITWKPLEGMDEDKIKDKQLAKEQSNAEKRAKEKQDNEQKAQEDNSDLKVGKAKKAVTQAPIDLDFGNKKTSGFSALLVEEVDQPESDQEEKKKKKKKKHQEADEGDEEEGEGKKDKKDKKEDKKKKKKEEDAALEEELAAASTDKEKEKKKKKKKEEDVEEEQPGAEKEKEKKKKKKKDEADEEEPVPEEKEKKKKKKKDEEEPAEETEVKEEKEKEKKKKKKDDEGEPEVKEEKEKKKKKKDKEQEEEEVEVEAEKEKEKKKKKKQEEDVEEKPSSSQKDKKKKKKDEEEAAPVEEEDGKKKKKKDKEAKDAEVEEEGGKKKKEKKRKEEGEEEEAEVKEKEKEKKKKKKDGDEDEGDEKKEKEKKKKKKDAEEGEEEDKKEKKKKKDADDGEEEKKDKKKKKKDEDNEQEDKQEKEKEKKKKKKDGEDDEQEEKQEKEKKKKKKEVDEDEDEEKKEKEKKKKKKDADEDEGDEKKEKEKKKKKKDQDGEEEEKEKEKEKKKKKKDEDAEGDEDDTKRKKKDKGEKEEVSSRKGKDKEEKKEKKKKTSSK